MARLVRLVATVVGLILYYATMRYLANFPYFWHLVTVSLILVVGGLVANAVHIKKCRQQGLDGEARSFAYCYVWQGLLLFALVAHLGYFARTVDSLAIDSWDKKLLLVVWLLAVIFGVALAIGIELSLRANGVGRFGEPRRVLKSGASWGLVGLLLAILLNINYLVSEHNIVSDWSYLQVTTLSDSSRTMLVDLPQELQVYAFMSQDDEIYPFVSDYLASLASANNRLVTTKIVDKELNPVLAEKYLVHDNGNLVLAFADDQYQKIHLGRELRIARRKLRDLDGQFQKSFLKLTASAQQVYFYRGHDEFTWQYRKDPRRSLRFLRALFKKRNYRLREFSLDTGSAQQVPSDAALVVIVGPRQPFIDAEVNALRQYLDAGGKALIFIDVGHQGPLTEFLQEIGLQFHGQVLANDRTYVVDSKSASDRWFIISNNFTSHQSVTTLAEHDRQAAVLFFQSGYFSIVANDQGWQVQAVLKSIPTTFVDRNRNYTFDQTQETRSTFDICAVAERNKGRLYACADATVISDHILTRNKANQVLVGDALSWLRDEAILNSSSEKDVKILHSKNEDLLLFYGTIVVMPLLILAVGLLASRRKK